METRNYPLYSEGFEHDACGIGAVVSIDGLASHSIVNDALSIVERLEHRAGKDATGEVGDGVGVLLQISRKFFSRLGLPLGKPGDYGVGMFFFPQDSLKRRQAQKLFEVICSKAALTRLGITGMTVSHVLGCGVQGGKPEYYRGVAVETNLLPKIQVDVVVSKIPVRTVIETAKKVLYTGHIGDGKIFVYDVENVVKVRTGEEGYDALQDVE